jgi:hypothetical protein
VGHDDQPCPFACLYLIFVRLCGWPVLLGSFVGLQGRGAAGDAARVAVLRRANSRPRLDWADRAGRRRADPLGLEYTIGAVTCVFS